MKRKKPESDHATPKRAKAPVTSTTPTAEEASIPVTTGFISECVTRHHLLGSAFFHLDPAHANLSPPDVLERFRDAAEERVWRLELHTPEEVFIAELIALDLLRTIRAQNAVPSTDEAPGANSP